MVNYEYYMINIWIFGVFGVIWFIELTVQMCSDLRYFNFYMLGIKYSLFRYAHIDLWISMWFYDQFANLIA